MCIKNLLFLLVVVLFLSACHDDNGAELLEFYKSQPRDPELIGWWGRYDELNKEHRYDIYESDGRFLTYEIKDSGERYKSWTNNYYYTKDNKIMMFQYMSGSWKDGPSFEFGPQAYKINGDTLFFYNDDGGMFVYLIRSEPKE